MEARSADRVDVLIEKKSIFQSDRVPRMRYFTKSQLSYVNQIEVIADMENIDQKDIYADVDLTFQTNSPLWAGSKIYVRLAGFQSDIVEVPLLGSLKKHFKNGMAYFDLAANTRV